MPTIQVSKNDLYHLVGLDATYPVEALEADLALVKGELKRRGTGKAGEEQDQQNASDLPLRIELADTNRPDLWCVEGVARQLRDHRRGYGQSYAFYTKERAERRIQVDARLAEIRPYIGGFLAVGRVVDEPGLLAFINGQESLDRSFGRRRKSISIGLYDGSAVQFPVQYRAVGREEVRFAPLTSQGDESDGHLADQLMTPQEVLDYHPTGREYAWTLQNSLLVPLLEDAAGEVLSLIPIINSARLGRVTPGMASLFVEATGMDLDQVLLTLNILAANLADRGWSILPVTTEYPYDTSLGRQVTAPHEMAITQHVPLALFEKILGEQPDPADIAAKLEAYGIATSVEADVIHATAPGYRQDYLHPVDVTEDYAISRGYDTFQPVLPEDFTVGGLHPLTGFEDLLRDWMIGFGFEEMISIILGTPENWRERMQVGAAAGDGAAPFHGGPLVSIQNVMNLNYASLRDWLLPSLLEIESHSEGAPYPHHIFEVGEVAVYDTEANLGSRSESRLAALVAEEVASFDSIQSVLYALLNALQVPFRVIPWEHPSFIPGRAGLIIYGECEENSDSSGWLGFLGEISPQVLTNWGVRVPAAGVELSVDALRRILKQAK